MMSMETITAAHSLDRPTSVSSSPADEQGSESVCLSQPWLIIVVLLISVVILTTATGNVLVILSYCKDTQVKRHVRNLYLLHLAVSDLLVGVVSMPMYLAYTACGLSWPLGEVACKVFLVEDYTCSTLSTLLVALISADRLALVRLGVRYTTVHTRRRAYVMLAACWVLAFLLFSPAILLWNVIRGGSEENPSYVCETGFRHDFYFTLVSEGIAFSLPVLLLTTISLKMFAALRSRNKVTQGTVSIGAQQGPADGHHGDPLTSSSQVVGEPNSYQPAAVSIVSASCCSVGRKSQNSVARSADCDHKDRNKRAVRISILLVLTLVILWLPYSLATIIRSACESCVNTYLYEVFTWMLWLKPAVNPFLYAFISPRFRKNSLKFILAVAPVRCLCRRKRESAENKN